MTGALWLMGIGLFICALGTLRLWLELRDARKENLKNWVERNEYFDSYMGIEKDSAALQEDYDNLRIRADGNFADAVKRADEVRGCEARIAELTEQLADQRKWEECYAEEVAKRMEVEAERDQHRKVRTEYYDRMIELEIYLANERKSHTRKPANKAK